MYKFLCRHMLPFLLSTYLGIGLLSHMVTLCLTVEELPNCQIECTILHSHQQCTGVPGWGVQSLYILINTCCCLFYYSPPSGIPEGLSCLYRIVKDLWQSSPSQSGLQAHLLPIFLAALCLSMPSLYVFHAARPLLMLVLRLECSLPPTTSWVYQRQAIYVHFSKYWFCIICGSYMLGIQNVWMSLTHPSRLEQVQMWPLWDIVLYLPQS